jgi:purine nucleosidase
MKNYRPVSGDGSAPVAVNPDLSPDSESGFTTPGQKARTTAVQFSSHARTTCQSYRKLKLGLSSAALAKEEHWSLSHLKSFQHFSPKLKCLTLYQALTQNFSPKAEMLGTEINHLSANLFQFALNQTETGLKQTETFQLNLKRFCSYQRLTQKFAETLKNLKTETLGFGPSPGSRPSRRNYRLFQPAARFVKVGFFLLRLWMLCCAPSTEANGSTGIALRGKYLFAPDNSSGLNVLDFSDRANPVRIGRFSGTGTVRGVVVAENHAFLIDGTGLHVLDITDPTKPILLGSYQTGGPPCGIVQTGKLLFIAASKGGLEIVNVNDPTTPKLAGKIQTGGTAVGVAVVGKYAYVADSESGLHIIDVANPAAPKLLTTYQSSGNALAVAVSSHYAFVGTGSELEILDIGDRNKPVRAGAYPTRANVLGLTLAGDRLFLSTEGGLELIDPGNPSAPKLLGKLEMSGVTGAAAISSSSPFSTTTEDIILDCDPGNDVDDMGDLAVIHEMANAGEFNILAVMYSMHPSFGSPVIEIANRFYGRPDLPIGVSKTSSWDAADYYGSFIRTNFYNSIGDSTNAPNAVTLYRKILAARPDHSVTILTSGQLRNIYDLWHSAGDSYSLLSGPDLLAQKIKRLIVVAGIFPSGREFNMYVDPIAASVLNSITNTVPVTFDGIELGNNVLIGKMILTKPEIDPIRQAYYAFYQAWGVNSRPAWSGLGLLLAARGYANGQTPLFTSTKGYVTINPSTGANTWTDDPNSNQEYLRLAQPTSYYIGVLEELLMRPPLAGQTITALVPKQKGGIALIDFTNPNQPKEVGSYELPEIPRLEASRDQSSITLRWPERFSGFTLQSTSALRALWDSRVSEVVLANGFYSFTESNLMNAQFYRLQKP